MANGGQKRVKTIIHFVEQHGWSVRETKKGYMLMHPNGRDQVLIHGTSSDHRAIQRIRTDLRRYGLNMPLSAAA